MIEYFYCFISTILTQIAFIQLFKKLTSLKPKIKFHHVSVIIVVGLIQMFLNLYDLKVISAFFSIIYFGVLFKTLFSVKRQMYINYSLLIWITCLLIDILLMYLGNIFNLMNIYIEHTRNYKAIASIILAIILIALSYIKLFVDALNKIYKKMTNLKITMNHITLIVIAYLFLGFMSSENMGDKFVVTILLLTGFSILVVIISFISMKYQLVLFKKTNEILEKNDIVNRKIITQYRVLKHNLESKLMGVKTVSNKEAKQLIDEMIKEYNSSFYIKHDVNDMPLGINGFVFEKLYKYKDENLDISVTNKIKNNILDSVGSKSYNLFCEALGVTLDNALEASKNSQEKLLYLEFNETKEKVTMKIINTFSGNIDLEKLGTVQYTSKETGHGFGLFSLIGRKNITVTTSIKNNQFINFIEIKKKSKEKE